MRKTKEIVKKIYELREDAMKSEPSSKELELDVLSQINSEFFVCQKNFPEIICLKLTDKYSTSLFEYAATKLLAQLDLGNKLLQKNSFSGITLYFFKIF